MMAKTRYITQAAVISAAYAALTLTLAPVSFQGPFQFRLSEALTVLPVLTPAAIPGLFLGCFLANLLNPQNLGPIDIILGSLATLTAAWLTWLIKKRIDRRPGRKRGFDLIALIPPILVNALVVGFYLPFLLADAGHPPAPAVIAGFMSSIAISQAGVIILIGYPLLYGLQNAKLKFADKWS
jgi:uncharacterized membrane protein